MLSVWFRIAGDTEHAPKINNMLTFTRTPNFEEMVECCTYIHMIEVHKWAVNTHMDLLNATSTVDFSIGFSFSFELFFYLIDGIWSIFSKKETNWIWFVLKSFKRKKYKEIAHNFWYPHSSMNESKNVYCLCSNKACFISKTEGNIFFSKKICWLSAISFKVNRINQLKGYRRTIFKIFPKCKYNLSVVSGKIFPFSLYFIWVWYGRFQA